MGVRVVRESRRGCGYRTPGGLYMMGGAIGRPCGNMPLELKPCPTCGGGIRQARSWTWIQPAKLWKLKGCDQDTCWACPLNGYVLSGESRCGLMWVGVAHYPTPADYLREAHEMGVSKRIAAIPKGVTQIGNVFRVDHNPEVPMSGWPLWVLLAHPLGMECPSCKGRGQCNNTDFDDDTCLVCSGKSHVPAIFSAFRPSHIEKVVNHDVSAEEVEKLEKRGIQPVIVERIGEQGELLEDDDAS